jgi:transcriptional regulator with XRE-family HTH domain
MEKRIKNYFAKNLKYLRRQSGLTQDEMADELNIGRPKLGSYEEERNEPNICTLINICKYFNISIDWLLTLDMEKESVI